ncbi:FAD/NAD(P)-binding domain-containing protein [Aspergillus aurantiobrunneus]
MGSIGKTSLQHSGTGCRCQAAECTHRHLALIEEKYESERRIQLQTRGRIANVAVEKAMRFHNLAQDPWLQWEANTEQQQTPPSRDSKYHPKPGHHKAIIIGAGFGGLLFAIRLIQTGAFTADDILLVDKAGGFGGTWYWNRYPGLRCDVESYIYLPLLEETGYMPREKYASGEEIRGYANRLARHWKLTRRALFQTSIQRLDWDDIEHVWRVTGIQSGGASLQLRANFIILAPGSFAGGQVPDFPNISKYQGTVFHTSRWNYACTGGTPDSPIMDRLVDKRVGIVGTGATAIQVIPQLAQYSQELLVLQRTPSAVDQRDNHPTDPVWWESMVHSEGPGWQRRRMENFNAFTSDQQPPPPVNLVGDGWTTMPSFSVVTGGRETRKYDYMDRMKAVDMARQERIRARVREAVENETAAEALTPWYSGWCKRPCFHDEYLSTFNRPNVHLVDVRRSGIAGFTEKGLLVDGVEHELDVVVLSTGYSVSLGPQSPGGRAQIHITGAHGLTMDEKWKNGLATLHGMVTRDMPNLFFTGHNQAGVCPNQMYVLDQQSTHAAFIMAESVRRAGKKTPVIQPSVDGEEHWARQVLSRMAVRSGAAILGCTPGYYNGEGVLSRANDLGAEEQAKMARLSNWGEGIASYIECLENWRNQGHMLGLEVQTGPT